MYIEPTFEVLNLVQKYRVLEFDKKWANQCIYLSEPKQVLIVYVVFKGVCMANS